MADLGELLVRLSADLKNLEAGLRKARGELSGFQSYAQSFSNSLKRAFAAVGLGLGIYEAFSLVKRGFREVIKASDDFHLATIGVAATITDMAEAGGRDLKDVYAGALAYAKDMYFELQEAAARYFASGSEMVQAWNILVQKGVVLQKEEIDNLGILVDKIKLATQGQVGSYQIAQEIRAMMDGHANAASQLALLLKSQVGEAWTEIAQKVRETQSLAPLVEHIKGLGFASKDIERTFESAFSTLKTNLQRIAFEGGSDIYRTIVNAIQKLNDWLRANRIIINFYISDAWKKVENAITSVWNWAKQVGSNLYTIFSTAAKGVWDTFGQALLNLIRIIAQVILWTTNWLARHRELVSALAQLFVINKLVQILISFGGAVLNVVRGLMGYVRAVPAVVAGTASLIGAARTAQMAFGGWLGVILTLISALGVLGGKALKAWNKQLQETPSLGVLQLMGEAGGAVSDETRAKLEAMDKEAFEKLKESWGKIRGPLTYPETQKPPELPPMKPPAGGGEKGKGGKEQVEDLLRYLSEYLEAKRRLEIQEAEESYQTFKTTQDKKKAEMELALAEGKLTGLEYYKALHEMAEANTAEHLKLIETKIAKEKEAYEWGKKEIEEKVKAGEVSPEAAELVQKKLLIEHTIRLKELEGEALRDKISLEKEHLDLLKQEYDNRKRIEDTLASGREEAALGPIAEKEAEIDRLLRERLNLRKELIRVGMTEAQALEFDKTTKDLEIKKRFGDQINAYVNLISGFFGDMIDAILSGEKDLRGALNKFFRSLFKQALEPAMKMLMQWLTDFFKSLFGTLGEAVLNGIMMIVALVGMFLTSGGSKSWTPSGVEKGVTHHEAVRGIIAGEETIPIAKVAESLEDALQPTNQILRQIEMNTRNLAGGLGVSVSIQGIQEAVSEAMDRYFREYLLMGAKA